MQRAIIHTTPRFQLTSYGNGLGYALDKRDARLGVFFQGDDADTFREQLEEMTEGAPSLSYDDALGCIWHDYSEAAQPINEVAQ